MSEYLWSLRIPIPPLPLIKSSDPCRVPGCPQPFRCTYDLTPRKGVIDGRCLTRRAAKLAAEMRKAPNP